MHPAPRDVRQRDAGGVVERRTWSHPTGIERGSEDHGSKTRITHSVASGQNIVDEVFEAEVATVSEKGRETGS